MSRSPLSRFAFAFAVLVLALSASAARSQITNVTNTTSTPIPGAGHDYIQMLSETVNPGNGSVSLRIQVPTPSGRALSLPFAFAYDSGGAQQITSDGAGGLLWIDNWSYPAKFGWSYSVPMLSNGQFSESLVAGHGGPASRCVYDDYFVFQDATGGRHSLYLSLLETPLQCPYATPRVPAARLSAGDDYYRAVLTTTTAPLLVADAGGTVYTFPHWDWQTRRRHHRQRPRFHVQFQRGHRQQRQRHRHHQQS